MKKIIFAILLSILFINTTYAFEIDIDKIYINSKSDDLIKKLDSSYKIDTNDFNNQIIYDENIQKYARKLLDISFSDKDNQTKRKELVNNMHYSKDNGFDTITGSLFIQNYVDEIEANKIKFNYIKDIKTSIFNDTDRMVFIYLPECSVNDKKQDIVVAFWLKSNDGNDFKLFYPWLTINDQLEEHFRKVTNYENSGINIGGTFNKIDTNSTIDEALLQSIYDINKNTAIQITGMNTTGTNMYGSGFFIKEGIVVTTWSLFLQFLTDSNYIFVNDVLGNTYNIEGIVSADVDYDIVVLKLNQEVGQPVVFGNTNDVTNGDKLFTINSKSNNGFVINYGTNITINNGRLENMFVLGSEDVGSALYNENGLVVGFNVADQLYSELSYANSTDYLKELQNKLNLVSNSNLQSTSIDKFKESYYIEVKEERTYNKVNNVVWGKYDKIGDIHKNITLDLLKASYVDNILSLRYKNETNGLMNSIHLVSKYTDALSQQGYKISYNNDDKVIYTNGEYKVVIKNSSSYLIVIIMEV